MRFPIWTVCLLLLSLTACDSGEDALEACSFDMQFSGAEEGEASGSAIFVLPEPDSTGTLPPPYYLSIYLAPDARPGVQGSVSINTGLSTLPSPGVLSLQDGDLHGWFTYPPPNYGIVSGAMMFEEVTSLNLMGSFDVVAVDDSGEDSIFVTAQFNARSGVEHYECYDLN
jgi:hypothetical protein